jgi:ATP-dependent Lon protease
MELIEMPGYIEDEKLVIARRYLVKRQLASAGLTKEQCEICDDVLRAIIRDYTREAGVRTLERRIGRFAGTPRCSSPRATPRVSSSRCRTFMPY